MQNQSNFRRFIFPLSILVLLIVLFAWLWHYLHTGNIIINTRDNNKTITLYQMRGSGSADKIKIASGHNKLEVSVGIGNYEAVAQGSSQASIQLIKVNSHKTLSYDLNPNSPNGVEPVLYKDAQDLAVSNNQLNYLDSADGSINKIDANNNLSAFAISGLQNVEWANVSLGIGQDNNNRLYSIVNGKVSSLNVPFGYGNNAVRFDISDNGQAYIASGADIYHGGVGGNFKKIFTADTSNLVIAASNNNLAIASSKLTQGAGTSKVSITVLDTSGKATAKIQTSNNVGKMVWSADGRYLVSLNETQASLYDAGLNKISDIPALSAVSNVSWLSNNRLLYSTNDELWIYNLANQRGDLLASMPLASPVTSIDTSEDGSYAYVTTLNSNTGGNLAIRRVGLKNQVVPGYVYQLQSILPLSVGSCNLSLVNFSKPTVLVQSAPGQTQQCQQQAKSTLQSRGFNLNALQISASS